jgi:hypothetical protein
MKKLVNLLDWDGVQMHPIMIYCKIGSDFIFIGQCFLYFICFDLIRTCGQNKLELENCSYLDK